MSGRKCLTLAVLSLVLAGYRSEVAMAAPAPITACGTTITASGSYKLANNLLVFEGGDCLVIQSGVTNVTIDLDGFTIECVCFGGDGIKVSDVVEGLTVRNGTIKGFTNGLNLFGNTMLIENMQLIRNTNHGLTAVESVRIKDSIFAGNGVGAEVGEGSVLNGNAFNFNTSSGLIAGEGSTIVNNSARRNGAAGLNVACPSNLLGNAATSNAGGNIVQVGSGCSIGHGVP
jgi:hypothetical protein